MKDLFNTVFLLVAVSASCFAQRTPTLQQLHPAVLSIAINPHRTVSFDQSDVHLRELQFKNPTNNIQIITRELPITKPLLTSYNSLLMLPNGPQFRAYPLLILPGDTIRLKDGLDGALAMEYSNGYPNFADSLISFPNEYFGFNGKPVNLFKPNDVDEAMRLINTQWEANEAKIIKLKLSAARASALSITNQNIKHVAYAHLLTNPAVSNQHLKDSLYSELYLHLNDIGSINAVNNGAIYSAIITCNAKKQHPAIDTKDFWACVAGADQQLKQTAAYKDFTSSSVAWTFITRTEEINRIHQIFSRVKTEAPILDTLYQLTGILSQTFTNFSLARQKLRFFAGGRYSFLIENDEVSANHEKKTIKNLPVITQFNYAGKKSDLKSVVMNKKYKLSVVDLWASWCVPCIAEIPHLRKIEDKMRGKPIQFVTISIDEDNQVDKWIKAAKENKIFNQPLQYRLANFKTSSFTRLINLKTIPRFLIIDNRGNILDEDFLRPSDARFQLELIRYLNQPQIQQ